MESTNIKTDIIQALKKSIKNYNAISNSAENGVIMRQYLKKLRREKKFSQRFIAEKLGRKTSCYGMIENGERQKKMNIDLISKLAEIFDVSVEWIIEQELKQYKTNRKVV